MSANDRNRDDVGRVPPRGVSMPSHGTSPLPPNAASGDAAYNATRPDVGRVPSHGVPMPSRGASPLPPNAASGDAAYNATPAADVGRVPPHRVPVCRVPPRGVLNSDEPPPRRLRRLHRVWSDRDGNISYLLTMCVDGRTHVLNNEATFERLVTFLLDSPTRYHWFGRRFVVMPDHIHLIAHMGHDALRLGQWIKALKVVVGGLERREERPVRAPGLQNATPDAASGDAAYNATRPADVGRVPSPGVPVGPVPSPGETYNSAGSGDPAYNTSRGVRARTKGHGPSYGEAGQPRIVAEVERRLSVVEELESVVTANLQRATRLRQSILQKAFTGELA